MKLRNLDFGNLEVAVPAEWSDNSLINFVGPQTGRFRENLVIARNPVPPDATLETYAQEQIRLLANSRLRDFELLEEGPLEVGGRMLYSVGVRWTNHRDDGVHTLQDRLRQDQYYCFAGGTAYTLTFTCLDDDYERASTSFQAILENTSFK